MIRQQISGHYQQKTIYLISLMDDYQTGAMFPRSNPVLQLLFYF